MKNQFDVIIVGGGPTGSYTAYQLADKGYNVCILEEKEKIGKDVICTGIVSKEAFQRFDLPTGSIMSKIDSFTFVSPQGQRLEYTHPSVFAYVVSREQFDEGLLRQSLRSGVTVYLNQGVKTIEESSDYYILECAREKRFKARIVVLATGVKYRLHNLLGMGQPSKFLYGSQIELPLSISPSTIQVHIGQHFAPGSFGWIAPLNNGTARIGVIIEKKGAKWLRRMLEKRVDIDLSKFNNGDLKVKPIANSTIKHSVKKRILAVGEAAGQVKTTTGGGILYGLLCSEIAVDRLCKTLKNGNGALDDYDITWRSALSSELDIGHRLRKMAGSLNDEKIEKLFDFVKGNRFWVQLLLPRISFDFHSNFLFYCLKSFQTLMGSNLES